MLWRERERETSWLWLDMADTEGLKNETEQLRNAIKEDGMAVCTGSWDSFLKVWNWEAVEDLGDIYEGGDFLPEIFVEKKNIKGNCKWLEWERETLLCLRFNFYFLYDDD